MVAGTSVQFIIFMFLLLFNNDGISVSQFYVSQDEQGHYTFPLLIILIFLCIRYIAAEFTFINASTAMMQMAQSKTTQTVAEYVNNRIVVRIYDSNNDMQQFRMQTCEKTCILLTLVATCLEFLRFVKLVLNIFKRLRCFFRASIYNKTQHHQQTLLPYNSYSVYASISDIFHSIFDCTSLIYVCFIS